MARMAKTEDELHQVVPTSVWTVGRSVRRRGDEIVARVRGGLSSVRDLDGHVVYLYSERKTMVTRFIRVA